MGTVITRKLGTIRSEVLIPNMGFIYMFANTENGKVYIGQTSGTVEDRAKSHIASMRAYGRHLADPKLAYKGTCTYLYKAMLKYGYESFELYKVLECPDESLDSYEIDFIELFNSLAPNGYNLTTGGGHFHHCDLTKQTIKEKVTKTMIADIDRFRSSEHTKGMPPYVAYCSTPNREAYYINNHPLHAGKKYFTVAIYGSLEVAKQACVDYVTKLNDDGSIVTPLSKLGYAEKGLRETKYGYRVRKDVKGIHYEKNFNNKYQTREQNLEEALTYIRSLQE